MNSHEQWALVIAGVIIGVPLLFYFFAKIAWAAKTKPKIQMPVLFDAEPKADDLGKVKDSASVKGKSDRIWALKILVAVLVLFAVAIALSYGYIQTNPIGDIGGGKSFTYNTTGVELAGSGGSDWKSIAAGEGGVKGELRLLGQIRTGDCVRISHYADKKGAKIQVSFRPLDDKSPPYKGEEVVVGVTKDTKLWCYTENVRGAKVEANAMFNVPEGVTATFKIE